MFQSRFLEPSGYWTSHSDSNQSLFLSDFFLLLYSPHFESCFLRPIFDSLQGSEKSFFCFLFFVFNAAKAWIVCQDENNISGTFDVHRIFVKYAQRSTSLNLEEF